MANIDVSFLLEDPDFADTVTHYRRYSRVNQYGENEAGEVASVQTMVVQGPDAADLELLPADMRLRDVRKIWGRGPIESDGNYPDVIVWQGKRYVAQRLVEEYMNYGDGFTCVLAVREQ